MHVMDSGISVGGKSAVSPKKSYTFWQALAAKRGVTAANSSPAAAKANQDFYSKYFGTKTPFLDVVSAKRNSAGGSSGASGYYSTAAPTSSPAPAAQLDYPGSPIASLYGMDVPTAYHEALANTAIQRRMADYQAAGLNPVLAASYGYGADSFSGQQLAGGFSGASPYAGANSGSSGTAASAKGFGDLMRNSFYRSALASIASAGTMLVTKNFQLGAAAYYGVKGYLNSRYGYRRK